MPELAFISLDPRARTQSASIRKVVRSQAAKSSAPQLKKQLIRAQNLSKSGFFPTGSGLILLKTVDKSGQLPLLSANEETRSPSGGLLSPPSSQDSESVGPPSDSESVGDDSVKIFNEPTHPLLLFQPLLTRPYSSALNHYYLTQMAIDIPDLDVGRPGSLRSVWYPYLLLNEGILEVILLLAGASFANSRQMSPNQMASVRSALIELKSRSLANIRQRVSRQAQHDDVTIATVLKMASYESTFGSTETYHLHMQALSRLIAARGGIQKLGLDGLLARMVLWVDYQAACLLNVKMHFANESGALPKPMAFGPDTFVGTD